MRPEALCDGTPIALDRVADRGLAYGDGLFETLRVVDGDLPWWPRHLARLHAGCRALGLPPAPAEVWREELSALLVGVDRAVLKLIYSAGPDRRGYARGVPKPRRYALVGPLPPADPEPLVLHRCTLRLAIQPHLAGLKHLNRLEQVLAAAEYQSAGCREGLVCDARERVVGAVAGNLFARRGGSIHTPRLDECGVRGVTRAWILEQCRASGTPVIEGELYWADLLEAEEIWLSNAVRGIRPVAAIGPWRARSFDAARELTQALRQSGYL